MPRLAVRLLGGFQVELPGHSTPAFESDKARALLAYLAVEADRPHRRDALAELLWPEHPSGAARANLRQTLHRLRDALCDRPPALPCLIVTPQDVRLAPSAQPWLDVAEFAALLNACREHHPRDLAACAACVERLSRAAELYRGDFLAGFSVRDSQPFSEWALLKQEELHGLALDALRALAGHHEQAGEYERAAEYARRQLELEPWLEAAHAQRMRALGMAGQREAALRQYEVCRRVLAAELNEEPSPQLAALCERIRTGSFGPAERNEAAPFVPAVADESASDASPFVARDSELARLSGQLTEALVGRGRVVFVTGEAGSGKTSLLTEFAGSALMTRSNLLIATGGCDALNGVGDPYLPFREVFRTLAGEVEAGLVSGTIASKNAGRLLTALPATAQALAETGPHLLDLFVRGEALLQRVETRAPGSAPWRARLAELVRGRSNHTDEGAPAQAGVQQAALFGEATETLRAIAQRHPLVIILDDLQWADSGSIGLLFHLVRHLAGSRILLVGAYRSEEVMLGRDGERHPLESVVNEVAKQFGDVIVDLSRADGREFIEALLDSEPNQLGPGFRDPLYRHTDGHALFTVELLRGLQERGDLRQDERGRWVEGPSLDFHALPARVEAAIAERVKRLPAELRAVLRLASVEGTEFTAEVIAAVMGLDDHEVYRRLSGPLAREHRLVEPLALDRVGEGRLSRYRFRHHLFQVYLYESLDDLERAHRHEAVGEMLERLYGQRGTEIALPLARHFERAGLNDRAAGYLLRAGQRAMGFGAYSEAVAHQVHGLALLESLPETPQRSQRRLAHLLALTGPLLADRGWGAPERAEVCTRAYALCQRLGGTEEFVQALCLLSDLHRAQGRYRTALELARQTAEVARASGNPRHLTLAYHALGESALFAGHIADGITYARESMRLYDREACGPLVTVAGIDVEVSCRSWLAWALAISGRLDEALVSSEQALACARALGNPLSETFGYLIAGAVTSLSRRDFARAGEHVRVLERLADGHQMRGLQPWVECMHGWRLFASGQVDQGLAAMRSGIDTWRAGGGVAGTPLLMLMLAECLTQCGRRDEALRVVDGVFEILSHSEPAGTEPFAHYVRGNLLASTDPAAAEASLRQAIALAGASQTKLWELRAATSLARLLQRQGRLAEAGEVLSAIYGWFTEGADCADLREARTVLTELGIVSAKTAGT